MSINIKNREAEHLLAELKRRTGKGTTDLLLDLLRRETHRVEGEFAARRDALARGTRELQGRWADLPSSGPELIGVEYDENGLPA